ncbi:MAG: hypothetical protein DRI36_06725 [Caldiserica bacterium]|nr:MAG: hypothetical protein DRI36_06725 [Caldisericota bacterium]
MIKVVRVDDRLIHGQVVEGWVKYYGLDKIIIVDDEIFNDEFQKSMMRFSLDESIKLEFSDTRNLKEKWKKWEEEKEKSIVLLKGVKTVLKLVEAGVELKELNVGCIHYEEGKYCIWKAIYWNDEEKRIFKKLKDMGVKIEGRGIPQEFGIDIGKLLEKESGK